MRIKKLCALLLAVALTLGLCSCSIGKKGKYEKAVEAVRNGRYQEAIESLEALDGYEDSAKYITYVRALQAGDGGDYENAIKALEALNGFEKSAVYITSYTTLACEAEQARMKSAYNQAIADVKAGNYDAAITAFETLNDYEDSSKYVMYARCLKTGDSGDYDTAIKSLTSMGDFKEAAMYIKYYTALAYEADGSYEKAAAVYDEILLFKDVQTRVAALPDKILDRDLAEAERKIEEDDYDGWHELYKLVSKKYTSSETRMYENIMTYAAQMHEKQEYEVAAELYLMVKEEGYEKANDRFKESSYQCARAWMTDGEYRSARNVIEEYLSDYKDANELAKECSYQLALETEAGGAQNAQAAYDAFKALGAYKDSAEHAAAYETKYSDAVSKEKAGEFDAAIALFTELGTFSDSAEWLTETQNAKAYAAAASLMASEKYEEAIEAFKALNGYSDSTTKIDECNVAILEREYQKALKLMISEKYEEAIAVFKKLSGYRDSDAQITECSYLRAEELRENGQYLEACRIYLTIKGYRDVDEIIEKDGNIANQLKFMVGNYVIFGSYPQTQNGNDKTPIEWLVLESDGETALLISRYALDCKPYNEKYESITWETCTLRGWLNNEFFNKAFSTEEKQYILQSDVSADKNPEYSTNPGNATKDNVFLLSIVEANKYFKSDDARKCAPTDYAIQQGAYTSDSYKVEGRKACWWWLRSPGFRSSFAASVDGDGSIRDYGHYVDNSYDAVRPCVRVRLF